MSLNSRVEARPAVALVDPDPSVKRKLEPFGAALGLDCSAVVACRPSDRGCNAGQPRPSNDDHRVSARTVRRMSRRSSRRRSIDHPRTAPIAVRCALISWSLDPPRPPEVVVQVNHRKIDPLAECASESGLAGTARPDDRNTLHEAPSLPHSGAIERLPPDAHRASRACQLPAQLPCKQSNSAMSQASERPSKPGGYPLSERTRARAEEGLDQTGRVADLRPPDIVLTGQTVSLRPFRNDDAADIAQSCHNPDIPRFTFMPDDMTEAQAREWVERRLELWTQGLFSFAITLPPDDRCVGQIGVLLEQRFRRAETFYWLDKRRTWPRDRRRGTRRRDQVGLRRARDRASPSRHPPRQPGVATGRPTMRLPARRSAASVGADQRRPARPRDVEPSRF